MYQTHSSSNNSLLCVTFNQDYKCFGVGTESGFRVWNTSPVTERYRRDIDDGSIGIVELLYKTNLIAFVGNGAAVQYPDNTVHLWDDNRTAVIAQLKYPSKVLAVRLRKDWLLVVLQDSVFVHKFDTLEQQQRIPTHANPTGAIAISSDEVMTFACPGSKEGSVQVFQVSNTMKPKDYKVHDNAVTQMALSQDGNTLATVSARGTIVRVWDSRTGNKLHEFRRGAQPTAIKSLAFNSKGTLLCLSSASGTIHVFDVSTNNDSSKNTVSNFRYLSGLITSLGDVWSWFNFQVVEDSSICCFGPETDEYVTVLVLGLSGKYYLYKYSRHTNQGKEEMSGYYWQN